HYPKQSFTIVADTPENLRLKQQSELQSLFRIHPHPSSGSTPIPARDPPPSQFGIHPHPSLGSTQIPVQDPLPSQFRIHPHPSSGPSFPPLAAHAPFPFPFPFPAVYHQHHQPQQQPQPPPSQSYGYKEPAAPASSQRNGPAGGGKRFRAIYDYNAADEDEVSFQDGDTIINVQQIDDGWMYGTVERTGDIGMLPANYVEAI
ncbi:LASP1 protein, partial [Erythrocercus mccallii]|nr:LASP1 protein [Erythrocercus mccallii]